MSSHWTQQQQADMIETQIRMLFNIWIPIVSYIVFNYGDHADQHVCEAEGANEAEGWEPRIRKTGMFAS
jgi:hypothetical protein